MGTQHSGSFSIWDRWIIYIYIYFVFRSENVSMEIPGWPGTGNQFIFEPTLKWLKQQSWLGPFFVGWQAGDRSQTHAPSTEIQPCLRENQYSGHKATQSPSYIIQFIRVENNEEPYTFIKPSWWSAQECAADDMQQTWKRHTVLILLWPSTASKQVLHIIRTSYIFASGTCDVPVGHPATAGSPTNVTHTNTYFVWWQLSSTPNKWPPHHTQHQRTHCCAHE